LTYAYVLGGVIARVNGNGFLKGGDRVVNLAFLERRVAEVVQGFISFGLNARALWHWFDCLVRAPSLQKGRAEFDVGSGSPGLIFKPFWPSAMVIDPAALGVLDAEIVIGQPAVGIF
jgi:hypothetical protein